MICYSEACLRKDPYPNADFGMIRIGLESASSNDDSSANPYTGTFYSSIPTADPLGRDRRSVNRPSG